MDVGQAITEAMRDQKHRDERVWLVRLHNLAVAVERGVITLGQAQHIAKR